MTAAPEPVDPTKDRLGTAYLDPATGDVYRHRGFTVDWIAKPFTGEEDRLYGFAVSLARGGFTNRDELPEGCVRIWSPS